MTLKLHPSDCRPHPLLERMAMEKETIEYLEKTKESDPVKETRRVKTLAERRLARDAFLLSVMTEGVHEAVKAVRQADGKWWIADGRHRWEAAGHCGKLLPAVEISEDEARSVILANLALRRHMKKSNTAWLLVGLYPEMADTTPGRPNSDKPVISREEHASRAGISADLLDQACQLWRLTSKIKAKRAQVDAAISSGKSLGGLLAGFKAPKTQQEEAPEKVFGAKTPTINSFCRTLITLGTQFSALNQWSEADQAEAVEKAAQLLRDNAVARETLTAALAAADAAESADAT